MSLAQDLAGVGLPAELAMRLGVNPGALTSAGTTQGTATAIPKDVTFITVTTASSQTGLRLPSTAELQMPYYVFNPGSTTGVVYPPTSGAINNGSANAGVNVTQGQTGVFVRISTNQWFAFSTSEPNILSTANTWTDTQTFSVAPVLTGGIPAGGGFTARPSNIHSGAQPPGASTYGTDATPVATETYICAVFIPCNMTITGVRIMNGSVASGNIIAGLFTSAGANVAATASTAMSGTDAYQQIAFSAPYAAVGPATYYVGLQIDNNTARMNMHAFGAFPASKKTGETYGTFTTITPPTTFTADVGPVMTLY